MPHFDLGGLKRADLPVASTATSESLYTCVDPAHPRTIADAFNAQAVATPGAIALRTVDTALTYNELNVISDRCAAGLRARGIGPGNRVGLLLPRSVDAIVVLLAILKTDAAFVPFDPEYSPELLDVLIRDCAPALIVAYPAEAGHSVSTCCPVVTPGELIKSAQKAPSPTVHHETDANSAAYVMYTSGSTGQPKGVVVPQRGVLRLVLQADYVALGPDEVILHLAPLGFDACIFEIFGALLNGGTLAIECEPRPSLEDIARAIAQFGVTTLWLTAGLFHLIVEQRPDALRGVRQLLAGGDVLSPTHVVRLQRVMPELRIINGYGPTENTTFTCCHTIPPGWDGKGPVPIGRPIRGTEVYILDTHLRPVAENVAGELCVTGKGVALGYLNQHALTALRFVPDPSGPPGAYLYRTGDLARRRPDGTIDFLGRIDRQVKINGKRVELEGIEAVLRQCFGVRDVLVTVSGDNTRRHIVAFVAGTPSSTLQAAIATHLAAHLPRWMHPSRIYLRDVLPLTPNGKIDRQTLLDETTMAAADPLHPGASTQGLANQLAAIWCSILRLPSVDSQCNFFDLGGTSLQAVEVQEVIRRELGRDISVLDLFAHPTVAALTCHLEAAKSLSTPVATARKQGTRQAEALRRFSARIRNRSAPPGEALRDVP